MLWFAEREFRLSKPQADGHSLREHFEQWKKMARKPHPEDRETCKLPETIAYLWTYFWDLSAGRPVSQIGPLPLPATEIHAWELVNEVKLEAWELGAIRKLDQLFLQILSEKK